MTHQFDPATVEAVARALFSVDYGSPWAQAVAVQRSSYQANALVALNAVLPPLAALGWQQVPPGCVVVPMELTPEIRAAVWLAQYQWHNAQLPADDNCSPDGVIELARRKVDDPRQAIIDQVAWSAGLLAAAPRPGESA